MKFKRIIALCFLITLFLFGACKKEAGLGGKNTIKGTVQFKNGASGNNDAAPRAEISIAYGSNGSTSSFDQTILANNDGTYEFETLRKGDYFIKATFTDEHGFKYTNAGSVVTFTHRKKEAEVNMILE